MGSLLIEHPLFLELGPPLPSRTPDPYLPNETIDVAIGSLLSGRSGLTGNLIEAMSWRFERKINILINQ